jgi:hypothetical protein
MFADSMSAEEALNLIERVLQSEQPLNDVQVTVFLKSWQGLSYPEIAEISNYDPLYIKFVGFKLWRLLSKLLGGKVTKSNIHYALIQYFKNIR